MAVRLRNQKNSQKTLGLATPVWREMLRLALANGWRPMGSVLPELPAADSCQAGFSLLDLEYPPGELRWSRWEEIASAWRAEALLETYLPLPHELVESPGDGRRLVLLEDALNLVDALDLAYQAYEPVRVQASYFLFEPDDPALRLRPGLGALAAAIEVCRQSSFSIEPWQS